MGAIDNDAERSNAVAALAEVSLVNAATAQDKDVQDAAKRALRRLAEQRAIWLSGARRSKEWVVWGKPPWPLSMQCGPIGSVAAQGQLQRSR
jgi:hypothetical protein